MLESLYPVKHSLPLVQSAFKRDFHHLYISCILRYTEDAEDSLTIFVHYAVGIFQPPVCHSYFFVCAVTAHKVAYKANWLELVRLHFQCVHHTNTTLVLDLALTVNTIVVVGNRQMTLVRRIVTRETIFNVVYLSKPSAIQYIVTTNWQKSSFDDVNNYKMADFGN